MREDTFTLQSEDGLGLRVYRWLPEQPARGLLQVVHGISEHARRYEGLARFLTDAGWAVVAHDHRGHGGSLSVPWELGNLGEREGWQRARADIGLVGRHASEDLGLRRVLLGHSMGSFMVRDGLKDWADELQAVALSGTKGPWNVLDTLTHRFIRLRMRKQGPRHASRAVNHLIFGFYNLPFTPGSSMSDWISSDPAEVQAYLADPHCGQIPTLATWDGLFQALQRLEEPEHLRGVPAELPILLFSGDRCAVGEHGSGVRRLRQRFVDQGFQRVELKLFSGMRHESLNERGREAVYQHLLSWLDQVSR